jgi:hypothetical protein
VVITVAFTGYLVAGLTTFLPCCILTGSTWPSKFFVEGITTAAAIKAFSAAMVVLVTRSLVNIPVRFP